MPTEMPARVGVALIHSPLVGAVTWEPAAGLLRESGLAVAVPALHDDPQAGGPFWAQHAASAAAGIDFAPHLPVVYVAHSGAGALLPAIRMRRPNLPAGYVFVDAGLPVAGVSRLDAMRRESAEWAAGLHQELLGGAVFPTWTDGDLRGLVPDDRLRRALVESMQPRGLAYFDEPIPAFDAWPDAPCVYIRFSDTYRYWAGQAGRRGWPVIDLPGGHFHMLADPDAVARAVRDALQQCRAGK